MCMQLIANEIDKAIEYILALSSNDRFASLDRRDRGVRDVVFARLDQLLNVWHA